MNFWVLLALYTMILNPLNAEKIPFGNEKASDNGLKTNADEFFDAELYDQAIPLYKQLLTQQNASKIDPEAISTTRYRLAQAYFLIEDYSNAATLIEQDANRDVKAGYLLALTNIKQGQYPQAIAFLETYVASSEATFSEEATFQLGLAYHLSGQRKKAAEIFQNLLEESPSMRFKHLSQLYIARIHLDENLLDQAEAILIDLGSKLPQDDLLHFEASFLRGEIAFQHQHYQAAAEHFEQALTKSPHFPWYDDTLYHLGWSYLKLGEDDRSNIPMRCQSFKKASILFEKLLAKSPEERTALALGQCYLARARQFEEESAYELAESLLSRKDLLLTQEAQAHALLLRAGAAPLYTTRSTLYRHLTQEINQHTPFYAKGWYFRSLNEFEQGKLLLNAGQTEEALLILEQASSAFNQAFELLEPSEKELAALALKYQAQALFLQNTPEKIEEALTILDGLLQDQTLLSSLKHPDEIYYIKGLMASHPTEAPQTPDASLRALTALRKGIENYPKGSFADQNLLLQGTLLFHEQQFSLGEETFLRLIKECASSPLIGEAWYWAARCADSRQESEKSREYRQHVFEQFPNSPYAPEAYFTYYSYYDYVQGDRAAMKHLQALPDHYPHSPYSIYAWYLVGLDYKRDRKTPEGKWIRKKNLTAAIDAFQAAESTFDTLYAKNGLPIHETPSLLLLKNRATLERALANLSIGQESQGAKQKVYQEYAIETFLSLIKELPSPELTSLQEEANYWLAQAYLKNGNDEAAEDVLTDMIGKYDSATITRGYYLSRAWYEKGLIQIRRKEYEQGLQALSQAEDSAKGKVLSVDQKLDLWIQQSLCYKEMKQLDQAILILSKVINEDAISTLRMKAMYLRAEAYEKQGRHELARRQLEAAAKKGGEWAVKASEKLEKNYGY